MTSAGVAAASVAGVGQRAIQSRQTGSTRATGVCCSMTSLTSTAQASTSGRRHGRSRAAVAYQSTRTSPISLLVVPTTVQCAVVRQRRAGPVRLGPSATVRGVLHPVGPLPAAVYWRRRVLVLTLLVSVLGGGGWLGWGLASGGSADATTTPASSSAADTSIAPPALERVVPSLASVQTPTVAMLTVSTPIVAATTATTAPPAAAPPPAPAPGSPCTDDMIGLVVRTTGSAPVGGKATFELAVTNASPVPCVRAVDKGLQELVLLDAGGARVWGSNDCFPEATTDLRTLPPGEVVSFPVVWAGLSSEPTCTAPRTPLAPGVYVLRGRLDTKVSPDAPLTVG